MSAIPVVKNACNLGADRGRCGGTRGDAYSVDVVLRLHNLPQTNSGTKPFVKASLKLVPQRACIKIGVLLARSTVTCT